MSDVQCVFVLGPDTPPELVLFAASIGRSLSRGNDVRFIEEQPEELLERDDNLARLRISAAEIETGRSRLVMCGDADIVSGRALGNIWRLTIACEPEPRLRLETEAQRFTFPLVMSPSILRRFGRKLSEIPRILIALDGRDDRRERMIVRTCEELHRRRVECSVVCIARTKKAAARADVDETYPQVEALELGSLIASSTLVLDPVEGDDAPSSLACLAGSVGVPVLTHASGLLARRLGDIVRKVAEWSPDAFVDSLADAFVDSPEELSWGMEFEAVVDDFGRVIQSA